MIDIFEVKIPRSLPRKYIPSKACYEQNIHSYVATEKLSYSLPFQPEKAGHCSVPSEKGKIHTSSNLQCFTLKGAYGS